MTPLRLTAMMMILGASLWLVSLPARAGDAVKRDQGNKDGSGMLLPGAGKASTREAPLGGPRPAHLRAQRPGDAEHPRRALRGPREVELPDEPMTAEQIDEFLAFARENFPRIHERLVRARESDPVAFRHMLRRAVGPLGRLSELKKRDPELAEKMIAQQKVEMQILELRREYYSSSSESERNRIRKLVREQLDRKFDLRVARLKLEVADLRKRLDEQTRRLAEQEKRKETIIQRELENFVSRGDTGGL